MGFVIDAGSGEQNWREVGFNFHTEACLRELLSAILGFFSVCTMFGQAEFTGLIALLLTQLGLFKLFDFFEKSKFNVHHCDQALVIRACH